MTRQDIGIHVLRLGLAGVFLYFGLSQLTDASSWTTLVPAWATGPLNLEPSTIVLANGTMEVVLGLLLAMRIWVRPIALILALHLIPIALGFGISATGVRDFGLSVATFALSLIHPGSLIPFKRNSSPAVIG
jgi:uncharacterized membrane protein YphA (DoxX/SURF4 family)